MYPSIYDALIKGLPATQVIMSNVVEGVDVMPSNRDLAGAEVELVPLEERERRLQQVLMQVVECYDTSSLTAHPPWGF